VFSDPEQRKMLMENTDVAADADEHGGHSR
jgi:hypothetical protein